MARGALPATSDGIAARVRDRRLRRRWSMRFLADRVGVAPSTISRIERGLIAMDNRYLLADVAAALECSVADLTGQPYAPADLALEAAHARVHATRAALTDTDLDEPPVDGHLARPVDQLTHVLELVEARHIACDYAVVLDLLPALLIDLHVHARAGDPTALTGMVRACYAAMGSAKGIGYSADAWMAAERARQAAQHLDQAAPLAMAEFTRAHAAVGCVGYRRAATITDRAIGELDQHTGEPTALEMLGMLHLSATYAQTALRDSGQALTHLNEARALARRTGETTSWTLAFGPANVGVWEVGLLADAGEPGQAIEAARNTDVSSLYPGRQATFYIDLARALAHARGRAGHAERALLTAERIAPQHTRSSPLARETARYLQDAARRGALSSALRGLCERMDIHAA